MTLGMFAGEGIDPALLSMLQHALGDQPEIQIRWQRE
jgi:hypothetical protein